MSLLKTTAETRTYCQASLSTLLNYSGMAMLGNRLPAAPGSDTWTYKQLPTVVVDKLSQSQINNIVAKNGNYFTTYKNVNVAIGGISPAGEYLDTVRGVDWLVDLIQTDVFTLFLSTQKVPYTDFGVDQIISVVKGDIAQAVRVGFLNGGDATTAAPTVTAPTVASQSATNRAKRIFPGIAFQAVLAGAIHDLTITGVVSA